MRILFAMIEPPLPFGNAAARWYYVLLRGLVERGHDVTAFASCSRLEEIDQARSLFPAPRYDLRLHPVETRSRLLGKWRTLVRPYSYVFSADLRRDWEAELARGFDVLHLEQTWCGWIGWRHASRALLNVLSLYRVDLADLDSSTPWRERLRARLAIAGERRLIRRFPHLRALSDRMAADLKAMNPRAEIDIVPLGLDPALYDWVREERRPDLPTLGLIGSMNWRPTRSAAERLLTRIWPAVRSRMPDARLKIAGWSARRALGAFLNEPGVTIEEDLPDPRPFFEGIGVLVYAPTRASGMKVKVLEAMAQGIPVVTTREGAEGLPLIDGAHAAIADDDEGLTERALALLGDRGEQERRRRAARGLVEAHCGPGPTVDAIERILRRIAVSPIL